MWLLATARGNEAGKASTRLVRVFSFLMLIGLVHRRKVRTGPE